MRENERCVFDHSRTWYLDRGQLPEGVILVLRPDLGLLAILGGENVMLEIPFLDEIVMLTNDEWEELNSLTDDVELAHARRMEKLADLARLRKVSLDDLMAELGLQDPGYV
jgi:hypothetical protein